MMNLIRALCLSVLPPLVVLVLQGFRMQFFPDAGEWDMLAHFLGGFTIAWGALILWNGFRREKHIPSKIPRWIIAWTLFGVVMFAGIAWELFEFGMQEYTGWLFQPSLSDTMNDFVMDMSGGLVFILMAWKKYR